MSSAHHVSPRPLLRELPRILRERRLGIGLIVVLAMAAAATHSLTQKPMYLATSKIILDKDSTTTVQPLDEFFKQQTPDAYLTQLKLIESRLVAEEVIRRLDLDANPLFLAAAGSGPLTPLRQAVSRLVRRLFRQDAAPELAPPPAPASAARPAYQYRAAASWSDATDSQPKRDVSAYVGLFQSFLKVEPMGTSYLVRIHYSAADPKLAADISNAVAEAFIAQSKDIRLKSARSAQQWLAKRVEEERRKLETSLQRFLEYKKEHGIITDFASEREQITAQSLGSLNRQLLDATGKRVEAQVRYEQAQRLAGSDGGAETAPLIMDNDIVRTLVKREAELLEKSSELSGRYGENHPLMAANQAELAAVREKRRTQIAKIIESLKNDYLSALSQEQTAQVQLEEQKRQAVNQDQKFGSYEVLQREAENGKKAFNSLVSRLSEISLAADLETGNVAILEPALPPFGPSKRGLASALAMGLALGLALGVGQAVVRDKLDQTVRTPFDLQEATGLPCLAEIPAVPAAKGKDPASRFRIIVSGESLLAEAFRRLRVKLVQSRQDSRRNTIMITSGIPGEGKTVTATNLAISLAMDGRRTLLIDCDLRYRTLSAALGLAEEPGMTHYLKTDDAAPGEWPIRRHDFGVAALDVAPAGRRAFHSAELLGSDRMAEFLHSVRQQYDWIVIDTPPLHSVADASVLAPLVDGALLVARYRMAHKELLGHSVRLLSGLDPASVGLVLNAVDMGPRLRYYSYYYAYASRAAA